MSRRNIIITAADEGQVIGKQVDPFWFAENATFPIRKNAQVKPYINGEEAWRRVHQKISGAKETIHIAVWWFEPGMRLIRSAGIEEGDDAPSDEIGELLVKKGKEGKKVRILLWDGLVDHLGRRFEYLMAQAPPVNSHMKWKLERDIDWLARAHMGVFENVTISRVAFNNQPATTDYNAIINEVSKASVGIPGGDILSYRMAKEVNGFNRFISDKIDDLYYNMNRLLNTIKSKSNRTLENVLFSHHQKTITVDGETAFVMGMNLRRGDWDTSDHTYDDHLRDSDRPRHDLIAELEGPCVQDVEYNFVERWLTGKTSGKPPELPKIVPSDPVRKSQKKNAQIIRTINNREASIREMYLNAIKNAVNYIYIENQYFRDKEIAQALVNRLNEHQNLKLLIVIEPDEGFFSPTRFYTSESFQILESFYGKNVPIYQLLVQQRDPDQTCDYPGYKRVIEGTYSYKVVNVHAKLMIVDDYFYTIGSANINARSMDVDSEINVATIDPENARNMRIALWSKHLNQSPGMVKNVADAVKLWKEIGGENFSLIEKNAGLFLGARVCPLFDPGGVKVIPAKVSFNQGELDEKTIRV